MLNSLRRLQHDLTSRECSKGVGTNCNRIGLAAVSEARRLRELEGENAKLKRLLADTVLDNVALTRRAA